MSFMSSVGSFVAKHWKEELAVAVTAGAGVEIANLAGVFGHRHPLTESKASANHTTGYDSTPVKPDFPASTGAGGVFHGGWNSVEETPGYFVRVDTFLKAAHLESMTDLGADEGWVNSLVSNENSNPSKLGAEYAAGTLKNPDAVATTPSAPVSGDQPDAPPVVPGGWNSVKETPGYMVRVDAFLRAAHLESMTDLGANEPYVDAAVSKESSNPAALGAAWLHGWRPAGN